MMPSPRTADESFREFWTTIESLLDAGRWTDASVTVRALSRRTERFDLPMTLGTLLYERGQRHQAVCEWTQALEAAQAAGDWSTAAAVHHNLAAMYRDIGDDRLARLFQQRATSLQSDCGPDELLQLGNDAVLAERFELAESLYQTAAELTAEDSPLLSDLAATRGILFGFQGEPREGLRWLQQAYREHIDTGDHVAAGKDLLNAAALFEQLDRLGWATMCLEFAEEHFESAGDHPWQQTATVRRERLATLRRVAEIVPEWN